MKTYSEKKNEPPFDWFKALSQKITKKFKLPEELREKSADWVTCACGNQCAIIPRDEDGMPLDDVLIDLGTEFNQNVEDIFEYQDDVVLANHSRKEAIETLRKIEERSAEIIREIQAPPPPTQTGYAVEIYETSWEQDSCHFTEKRAATTAAKLKKETGFPVRVRPL